MPTCFRAAAFLTAAVVCTVSFAEETTEVAIEKLKFNVPKSWKQQEEPRPLRLATFTIPAVEGDSEPAELAITPPIGGTAKANIERWIGQFESKDRELKLTKGTSPQGEYVFVELSGTYKKPDGPPFLQRTKLTPNYRMHGVILTVKGGGNYYLKLTGPDKTVAAQSEPFRTSFGAKAADETKFELE